MKKKILSVVLTSMMILSFSSLSEKPAYASTKDTLNVYCSDTLREVTHCGSGSLYGVTEDTPSKEDISEFITPLNPCVFTNPAEAGKGYQQNMGAATPVAERLNKNTSGKVMIRLADLFPDWPYKWTNLEDWKSKVTEVINKKKSSEADNFYGYEIWNEPCFTWNEKKNNLTFNELWKSTYDLIRSLDPDAEIVGPSEGYYDHSKMSKFLNFCKENDCIPDVISWHELTANGKDVSSCASNLKDCRKLAKSLGIDDVKISINEYCDTDHYKEGQPASSACYIAKFERYLVDSACISWWFTKVPGRLGSLMASDNEKGAGWWFYKWYGDMSGNMVNVTPPDENSRKVDGFACVDSDKEYISVLLGGENDGNIDVNINNIPSFISDTANVTVEKVDWVDKDTPVDGTSVVLADNYKVSNGKIHVSIPNTNNSSGYRVYISNKAALSDKEAVKCEEKSLKNSIPKSTQTNLNLPKNGAYGTKITWKSSNKDVIDNNGVVNIPEEKTNVTLEATISKGDESVTKEFNVIVNPLFEGKFEAEEQSLSNAEVFYNDRASAGAFVGHLYYNEPDNEKYSYVDFKVNMEQAGKYKLTIGYSNGDHEPAIQGLAYNGGAWQSIKYPSTGDWASFGTINVDVNLNKGENIIRLAKGSPYFSGDSGNVELDYIKLKQN